MEKQELLFRGKRLSEKKWVQGGYVYDAVLNKHTILEPYQDTYQGMFVEPDSVGQYIGIRDRNGNRIFTGDIIEALLDDGDHGTFKCRNFITWNGHAFCWCETEELHPIDDWDAKNYSENWEVVGNMFDNLELMKDR